MPSLYQTSPQLKKYAVPELVLLAEVDGEPAGRVHHASLLQPGACAQRPVLLPTVCRSGCAALYNMRHIKTADGRLGGRRRNSAAAAWSRCSSCGCRPLASRAGYTGAELSWTLEDNDLICRTIEKVGGRRYKTFRLYGCLSCFSSAADTSLSGRRTDRTFFRSASRHTHTIDHAGRSQLHLRRLRRRDRDSARPLGRRKPGVRRGLPRLLPPT